MGWFIKKRDKDSISLRVFVRNDSSAFFQVFNKKYGAVNVFHPSLAQLKKLLFIFLIRKFNISKTFWHM